MYIKKVGKWLMPGLLLSGLGFLCCLGFKQLGFSQENSEHNTPKIGVVNMIEVFGKYKKTKEYETLLEKEKKKEELKIQDIEKEIKTLMDEIDALDKYSELRREKNERLAILSAQREYRAKNWNNWIRKKVNEHTVTIYNEIKELIGKYAKEHGYIFILKSEPTPLEVDPEESAADKINIRAVLYYDKTADLTEEIIKILNER
jgi:Skp family chaperone for outer membrane proteins